MTFSRYVCWKPEMVRQVMDVEATQPEDYIFLATHHPTKMYRQNLAETVSQVPYDEERFLRDFLATPDFSFVPILGASGTGKSHLIRWLYTRLKSIRREPNCRVLLIPKVGTNLKDIIERILAGIEGLEFDEYRSRLRQAANTLTEDEACEQLLANLAIAVGSSGHHEPAALSEAQSYLVEVLPAFLFDPFFRQQWLRKEGIIHRLVVHTLGTLNSVEVVEERRGFSLADLPLNVAHVKQASAQAQEFYGYLIANDEVQRETVNWLNAHLDIAIAKVLNLGREDLQRLMLDVRRALAKQGVELILLIEDFAKLQGIDREVLEAVLARPQQVDGEPLCAMRTALACTSGYFEKLIDTVRTRTDFSVNLDIETVGEQSLVTQTDVQQLASRYLNTVRLDSNEIQSWLADADEETGQPYSPVPNACLDCEFRPDCHTGFGQIDGIGLYPFNAKAIEQMRDRVNTGVFNPRTLIRDVLRHTLEYHQSDLEEGRFPTPSLLAHFGGSKLSGTIKRDIDSKDTPNDAGRRETLLNLWTNGNELCDLLPEVHTAFDLSPLGVQVQNEASAGTVTTTQAAAATSIATPTPVTSTSSFHEKEATTFLSTKLAEQLQALDNWQNGVQLAQDIAQDLRELIFPAISRRIDWDVELILKKAVIGQLFLQRNINFSNATTSTNPKGIELRLPLDGPDNLRDTAIALQGMLLYKHYKNWKFSYLTTQGLTYFRIYASKLEEWSNFVFLESFKYSTQSRKPWNPIPAVIELLAIAGRMAGRPTDSLEDRVNAIFTDLEKVEVNYRASTWQKLFNTLKKNQPKLQEILQTRIPCTKGGSTVLQIIDASQVVAPLKSIVVNWQPQVDVSDVSLDQPFKTISDTRKAIDEFFKQAVLEERDRQLNIYQRAVDELGEDFAQKEVVATFSQTVECVRGAGIPGISNRDDLTEAIKNFENAKLKNYLELMKKIQNTEEVGLLFQYLSTASERPLEVISSFLNLARPAVDRSLEVTQKSLADLRNTGGMDLERSYTEIEKALLELQKLTVEIKGEPPCS